MWSLPPSVVGSPESVFRNLLAITELISVSVEVEVVPEPCLRITVRPRSSTSPNPFPESWWR